MAIALNTGWTAASLLPSIASGFSPGSVGVAGASSQVSGNPNALKAALDQKKLSRMTLLNKIMGMSNVAAPSKQPGINPAVNSTTTRDFSIPAGVGAPGTELIRGY